MTHFIAAGSNKPREKNVWHFTKTVRGPNLQNHRSILNNKHYGITKSVSKKQKMGRSRYERDTNYSARLPFSSSQKFSRFLSKSYNLLLCFWSQQEEFHPQLSHIVEFMLIKICSIYPNICARVNSCIHSRKEFYFNLSIIYRATRHCLCYVYDWTFYIRARM